MLLFSSMLRNPVSSTVLSLINGIPVSYASRWRLSDELDPIDPWLKVSIEDPDGDEFESIAMSDRGLDIPAATMT